MWIENGIIIQLCGLNYAQNGKVHIGENKTKWVILWRHKVKLSRNVQWCVCTTHTHTYYEAWIICMKILFSIHFQTSMFCLNTLTNQNNLDGLILN